jgi:hypothetical protein
MMRLLALLVTVACAAAYTPSVSRRQAFQTFVAGALVGTPAIANALDACNPKANNCVFKTWTPPSGTSKSNAIKDLRSVIEEYPQAGQAVSYFVRDDHFVPTILFSKVLVVLFDRMLMAADG